MVEPGPPKVRQSVHGAGSPDPVPLPHRAAASFPRPHGWSTEQTGCRGLDGALGTRDALGASAALRGEDLELPPRSVDERALAPRAGGDRGVERAGVAVAAAGHL